jgi:hypothetical protein
MALYFSPDPDPDIWHAMHGIATRSNLEWLREVSARKHLQPWLDVDRVADDIVRLEYATIHAWAQGHIPDDEIVRRLLVNYLTFAAGATRGATRKEVDALLAEIQQHDVSRLVETKFDMTKLAA